MLICFVTSVCSVVGGSLLVWFAWLCGFGFWFCWFSVVLCLRGWLWALVCVADLVGLVVLLFAFDFVGWLFCCVVVLIVMFAALLCMFDFDSYGLGFMGFCFECGCFGLLWFVGLYFGFLIVSLSFCAFGGLVWCFWFEYFLVVDLDWFPVCFGCFVVVECRFCLCCLIDCLVCLRFWIVCMSIYSCLFCYFDDLMVWLVCLIALSGCWLV